MRWGRKKKLSPIGLDLGTHSFKAVQLERAGGRWRAVAAVSLARVAPGGPLTAADVERLHGVLGRRGFAGRDAVLAVPAAGLLSSILELPARAPGVPLEQIAAAEFARVNKLDAPALSMATWELPAAGRASRATYMMAVGVRRELLDAHVDLVEATGLNVIAVDEPHSAAVRGGLHGIAMNGLTAVIDLGWQAARLAICYGGTLIYTRTLAAAGLGEVIRAAISVTGGAAEEDVRQELWRYGLAGDVAADTDVADALGGHVAAMLREIGQAFGYAEHQYPDAEMTAVRLVGGGAALPGIGERFSKVLRVAVEPAGDAGAPAGFSTAKGLALWEVGR